MNALNAKELKIVFLGTPEFATASLRRLVEGGYNVAAVVTMPDKPAGRGQKLQQSDVRRYAVEAGLKVLQPERLRDEAFLAELHALEPDLGIVIAFRMLPEAVWSMPRLGTFNLHASLLPQYRGAAPINRAIMNGETRTGLTTFMLDAQIDTGAIVGQAEMTIDPDDDAGSLHDRMMTAGAELVVETVEKIAAGTAEPLPQPLVSAVELHAAPKIFKEDCRIDRSWPGAKIVNHIRGLAPYPGAWTEMENGTVLKILSANFLPGTGENAVTGKAAGFVFGCADGRIEVMELQPAGKRRMSAKEYLNGLRR